MAIEIISVSTFNNSDVDITVPSGLTNSAIIAMVGTHQGDLTSLTYGSDSLTQLASGSSAFDENGDIWILLSPTAGTATITGGGGGSFVGGVILVVQGIKQTTSVTTKTDQDGSNPFSNTFVPPAGNVLVCVAYGGEADITSGASPASAQQTNIQASSFENAMGEFFFLKTGSPTILTFTQSSGQRYGLAIAAFVEPDNSALELAGYRHLEVKNGMSRAEAAT